ncbi:MAG: hypothetical protein K2M34_01740 [Alphaproteobacteria bacterium]|nr:hypothetical protein [Alphaproteobacteria bacterium]
MTDTIDKFGFATAAVQQMANTSGAGYKRGMNQVFNLAAALQARGINLGTGFDNIEK